MASSLAPAEMEARLRAFYDQHNPGNQQNIAEIVRKYCGKEAALCAKLQKKYGVAPNLVPAATSTKDRASSSVPTAIAYDPAYTVVTAARPAAPSPPSLDFYASTFDAGRALQTRALAPPVTGLAPLDNIHKCRPLLPVTDPNYQKPATMPIKKPKEKALASAPRKPSEPMPMLFEALADTYLDGPFTLLRQCFLERKRVCVVVRRVNSVRGTVHGFLKAFDKHMNLVLLDVQQQWIPHQHYAAHDRVKRLARDAGDPASAEPLLSVADERRNRGFTTTSYAKQLFVRGDNIVMVLHDNRTTSSARREYTPRTQRR